MCEASSRRQPTQTTFPYSRRWHRALDVTSMYCMPAVPMTCSLQRLLPPWPQVRRHSAEQLYLQMLAAEGEDDSIDPEDYEQAMAILMMSPWDGDVEALREPRVQLAGLLHVELPQANPNAKRAAPKMVVRRDENESYQSLLDDAARGGGY